MRRIQSKESAYSFIMLFLLCGTLMFPAALVLNLLLQLIIETGFGTLWLIATIGYYFYVLKNNGWVQVNN